MPSGWLPRVLIVVAGLVVSVAAADVSGVRGRISDPEGLPLPGVAVTVRTGTGAALPKPSIRSINPST